jgi:hypothetical protein
MINVAFTIGVLLVAALWWGAVYNRLIRLRAEVKVEFKRLEASEQTEADGKRYNDVAEKYNGALQAFPANIIASMAGFRPAQMFVNTRF